MAKVYGGFAVLTAIAAAGVAFIPTGMQLASAEEPQPAAAAKLTDAALPTSAIRAGLDANNGKPPGTGDELWKALEKVGKFAQLPVVFSSVRLDSGLSNPRVVITPIMGGLGNAALDRPSTHGRLYLAANMEKGANGGDPRVTSVEFISWNSLRRQFDFGFIESMGGGTPRLQIVDSGRCISCHKTRGPILGEKKWSNTTDSFGLRLLVADKLRLRPLSPNAPVPAGGRERIDGMALAIPQAQLVDNAVRVGSLHRLNRETFHLMNRYPLGRKAFVAMLVAISHSGPLDANARPAKTVVDQWGNDQSYLKFAADWVAVAKTMNTGILINYSQVGPLRVEWAPKTIKAGRLVSDLTNIMVLEELQKLRDADAVRAAGRFRMPSAAQPSNPRAFRPTLVKAAQRPSMMVNPVMLANTVGLTEPDRKYLAEELAYAAKKIRKENVTAATLARAVYEGPEFADVLEGGPLPDRDEFKDRFVAGLGTLMKSRNPTTEPFNPNRKEYASSPRYDPKLAAGLLSWTLRWCPRPPACGVTTSAPFRPAAGCWSRYQRSRSTRSTRTDGPTGCGRQTRLARRRFWPDSWSGYTRMRTCRRRTPRSTSNSA
jgi:hypothetical protein